MILEFSVTNFRSIKHEQTFSMVAEATKSKPRNVFEARLAKNGTVRLLNAAVIYGPNASGKSNLFKAFYALGYLIGNSERFKIDQDIPCYEPFLLDLTSKGKPTRFELSFIGKDEVKYVYTIEYGLKEVFSETLDHYPKGQQNTLFSRKTDGGDYHEMVPNGTLKKTGLVKRVLKNQLLLSRYGTEPHEQLNDVYRYFQGITVANATDSRVIGKMVDNLAEKMHLPENEALKTAVNSLVRAADAKIDSVLVKDRGEEGFEFLQQAPFSDLPDDVKTKIKEQNKTQIFTNRSLFENGLKVGETEFDLKKNDSIGTITMFAFGGLIIEKLQKGGLALIDEMDNSLHPKLARFMVQLFSNPDINTKNAQLIFTTHEPLLMDKDMFRSDQIWFTEKNGFGETEIFSAQHFDGVREDIPFDKWYMAGKFGALPKINELEFHL